MKTFRFASLLMIAALTLLFLGGVSTSAAQKKAKAKPAPVAQPQQKEKEEESEEVKTPEPAAAPQPAMSATGAVLDILKKYIGQKTNLGILKKVTSDYVEIEDDNVVLTVPTRTIHSLKQVTEKDVDDKAVVHLEIRLYAKD